MIVIRRAIAEDAASAAEIMRRSIEELCSADHNDDPGLINDWTANKTTENVAAWINKPTTVCVTAIDKDENVVGFSMMSHAGEILLLYVAPEAVRCGVGKGMLKALEAQAKFTEIPELHLLSTKTARAYYVRYGFSEQRQPQNQPHGLPGYPMRKLAKVGVS